MTAVFIFQRSFRLHDNLGLLAALEKYTVIPIFIFTYDQVRDNEYFNKNSFQFMLESLQDLQKQLTEYGATLYLFYSTVINTLEYIIKYIPIQAVYVNTDYTPYARTRDRTIKNFCTDYNLDFHSVQDYTLINIGQISEHKKFYKVFSPFYKYVQNLEFPKPRKIQNPHFYTRLPEELIKLVTNMPTPPVNPKIVESGGRIQGLQRLRDLKKFSNYAETRDNPNDHTTMLSAHLKYGTISIREVYHRIVDTLGADSALLRELFFHDFYASLMWNLDFYDTLGGGNFKHLQISWKNNKTYWNAWKTGTTGFPLVDAAMRQLVTSGYMNNRCRMVVASTLTLLLNVDWKKGEKFFAKNLVDYDPSSNVFNWQIQAGVGPERGFLKVFNPWTQGKKYDPKATYIKTWIPELQDVPASDIHQWNVKFSDYSTNYPEPIVEYEKMKKRVTTRYRGAEKY